MSFITIDIDEFKRVIEDTVKKTVTASINAALRADSYPTAPAPPGSYLARRNQALENHEKKKNKKRAMQ